MLIMSQEEFSDRMYDNPGSVCVYHIGEECMSVLINGVKGLVLYRYKGKSFETYDQVYLNMYQEQK